MNKIINNTMYNTVTAEKIKEVSGDETLFRTHSGKYFSYTRKRTEGKILQGIEPMTAAEASERAGENLPEIINPNAENIKKIIEALKKYEHVGVRGVNNEKKYRKGQYLACSIDGDENCRNYGKKLSGTCSVSIPDIDRDDDCSEEFAAYIDGAIELAAYYAWCANGDRICVIAGDSVEDGTDSYGVHMAYRYKEDIISADGRGAILVDFLENNNKYKPYNSPI